MCSSILDCRVEIWQPLLQPHPHTLPPKRKYDEIDNTAPDPTLGLPEAEPDPEFEAEDRYLASYGAKQRRTALERADSDADAPWAKIAPEVVSQYLAFLHCRFPGFLKLIAGDAYGEGVNALEDVDEEAEMFAGKDVLDPRPARADAGVPHRWYVERAASPVDPVVEGEHYVPALVPRVKDPQVKDPKVKDPKVEIPLIGPGVRKFRRKVYFNHLDDKKDKKSKTAGVPGPS